MRLNRKIQKTSGSLWITIPKEAVDELNLKTGDILAFDINERKQIIIEPVTKASGRNNE